MRDDAMRRNVPQALHMRVVQTLGSMKARSSSQAYRHRRRPLLAVHLLFTLQFSLQFIVQFRSSSSSLNRPWLP
jgi:hypothetical protein